jgi:hypothetical protein
MNDTIAAIVHHLKTKGYRTKYYPGNHHFTVEHKNTHIQFICWFNPTFTITAHHDMKDFIATIHMSDPNSIEQLEQTIKSIT